jgi:lysylphosphatidylglycerol synthetase-like protein (DUF2156 family)
MADVYWERSDWKILGDFLGVIASVVAVRAFQFSIPSYYQHRFGRVQQRSRIANWSRKKIAMWVIAFLVFAVVLYVVACVISAPRGVTYSLAMSLIMISFVFPPVNRRFERAVYTLLIGLSVALVALYPLLHSLDARQFALWRILNAAAPGRGLAAIGLCDHITLVCMLPKRVTQNEQ